MSEEYKFTIFRLDSKGGGVDLTEMCKEISLKMSVTFAGPLNICDKIYSR